jgi:integrase
MTSSSLRRAPRSASRSALDVAVQRRLLDHNVTHSTFLSAARSRRLYSAVRLAAHTGMGRGEIVGLKWADLDRSTSRVSVRRAVQSLAGQAVECDVQTRTSRRCIDLDPATITELDRWRGRLRLDGLP